MYYCFNKIKCLIKRDVKLDTNQKCLTKFLSNCCGDCERAEPTKQQQNIQPNIAEPTRMENESRSKTWSCCLIWKQNPPARCRRFTGEGELQQLSARASVIRNVRVVRLARTLTLRFIFLSCDLYGQNKKVLEYTVDN